MDEEIKNYKNYNKNNDGESSHNFHRNESMQNNLDDGGFVNDDGLGALPNNWEQAYTENGEVYYIDHNTGESHWLDPRFSKFQKKSLQDCSEDELPYGWEKIQDPEFGIYFIDHVNRKTQYENPVIQAKRQLEMNKSRNDLDSSSFNEPKMEYFFTKNPSELCGERISTTLVKSSRGLGFTIVGGDCGGGDDDDGIDEFLQIKAIVPNGPASRSGKLRTGDILVFVNDICVLGFTHHEMVNIFQSIMPGDEVLLNCCRGYPLPFDPNDPNTEVVTTIAVDGLSMGDPETEKNQLFLDMSRDNFNFLNPNADQHTFQELNPIAKIQSESHPKPTKVSNNNFDIPEMHNIIIVKGAMGFGFTIADSVYGQKVKKILDRQCCKNLNEGDILLSINKVNIKNFTHNDVVQVLKDCPKNQETILRVQRGLIRSSLNKFNGKGRTSKVESNSNSVMNGKGLLNGMFRSKTPTADIYSTQQKETLPIRPKTPLVDTRARIKTPILTSDLNTDEIEMDSKLTDHNDDKSTAPTPYDTTKLLADNMDNLNINDQRSETYTTTDSITSKHSFGKNRFFSPLDIKNGNTNGGDFYYGNQSNINNSSVYSLPPPPPPIPPPNHLHTQTLLPSHYIQPIAPQTQSTSTIPYQHAPHDSCFCYDCQDYRLKQQQQQQQQQQQYSSGNMDYNYLQSQFNLPPQMSDNVGKRINDYLDRKRNADLYHNYNLNRSTEGLDDFYYTEVTLDRQALGFGFRIVGGTEEGSQVCVGHIVKDGAADKDPRISAGDEIVNINGVNVECASHHRVVKLMGDAALRGQVMMLLRKRKARNFNNSSYRQQQQQQQQQPYQQSQHVPYYNVVVNRHDNEGFGFVIISSSNQMTGGSTIGKLIPNSPAERCGELKIGDRIIAVNDIDIMNVPHGDVVKIIKDSGLQVQLTVGNLNPVLNQHNGSNQHHQMQNHHLNMNDGQSMHLNGNMNSYPIIS